MDNESKYSSDFELLSQLTETQALRAWRINFEQDNLPATLWASKISYENNESKANIRSRLHYFKSLTSDNLMKIHAYGFDKDLRAFYITDPFDTKGILESASLDPASQREAERRFMQILKIVSRLQKDDIYFGNLTPDSFLLHRDGNMQICAYIPNTKEIDLTENYNQNKLNYFAPEFLKNFSEPNAKHDVYSLGMIAFWLFSGEFPFNITLSKEVEYSGSYKKKAMALSEYHPWLAEFLEKTLTFNAGKRFESAEEALRFIYDYRNKKLLSETLPTKLNEEKQQKTKTPAIYTHSGKEVIALTTNSKTKIRNIHFCYLVAIIILGFLFYFDSRNRIEDKIALIQSEKVLTFSELNRIKNLIDKKMFSAVAASVDNLALSEDPLVVNFLSEIALKASNVTNSKERGKLFSQINKAILSRINLENFPNVYKVYEKNLELANIELTRKKSVPDWYESFVILSNLELPFKEKAQYWDSLSSNNIKLAGALILAKNFDGLDLEEGFKKTVLSSLYEAYFNKKDFSKESYLSLSDVAKGFINKNYYELFNEYLNNHIDKLSKEDVKITLPFLALKSNKNFIVLNEYASKKSFFSDINQILFDIIKSNLSLNVDKKRAILNIAFNNVNRVDIKYISNWMHSDSTRVLLILFSDEQRLGSELKAEDIFDVISARNHGIQPMQNFAEWMRDNYWEKRGELSKLLCMVTYPDFFTLDNFKELLRVQKKSLLEANFLNMALNSIEPKLVLASLDVFKENITLGDLLVLLKHPSIEVRKTVIPKIDTNDLTALKIIRDALKEEKNQDVINLYKETGLL